MTITYVKGENNSVADYLSRTAEMSDTVALLCDEGGGAGECDNLRVRQEPEIEIASLTPKR